jgi:enediyne biosynthesis protein E4
MVVAALAAGCDRADSPAARGGEGAPSPASSDWFVDEAQATGLDFTHVNGMSGHFYMPEVLAPGVAFLDYDNDGDLDVYLVQGQPLVAAAAAGASPLPSGDRLFRNDLAAASDGTRHLKFVDVTASSRIAPRGYGMGVAAGDVDNDGRVDLYLTKFNAPNELWHNNGDGTFADRSARSRTNHMSWSTSAAFADIDRDGWLDLYVASYLRYSLENDAPCASATGARDYCTPDSYQPLPGRLYLNRRDGTFADVSVTSGIAREYGPGLGLATADFDRDGWIDIYVANDGKENQLWINRRNGAFENTALLSGVALPVTAKAEASMGVDAGDFDDDGDEDLFVTELTGEGSNLYVNDGSGVFEDRSTLSGLGPASLGFTGFGTAWLDFDNDGRLDLLAVNGAVQVIESLRQAGDPLPLHQRKLLLQNRGAGRFEDVSARAGAALALSEIGRGAAFGDVDNDGDVDVLVGNNNGPARLLVNRTARRHWVGLRLAGATGRDMLGARAEVLRPGAPSSWRRARADGSYASANDPRVLVGLADAADVRTVRVTWPAGKTEMWTEVPVDQYTTLVEGKGR